MLAPCRRRSPRERNPGERAARGRSSLLWKVFLANGSVLVVALLLFAFSAITVDTPIQTGQFAVLVAGFLVLVALNLVLLQRVLAPFFQLTDAMSSVDPDRPGRRLAGVDPRAAEGDPALAPAALHRVADAVRESLDEVRRIAREQRVDQAEVVERLGSQLVELVIYRIAQEGLTNALRHSGASTATVALTADAETLTLRVADDGRGMPATLPSRTAGIAGMRERALLVNGRLSIQSRPGGGTEVRLSVPVGDEAS